jgi:hypothetical protein
MTKHQPSTEHKLVLAEDVARKWWWRRHRTFSGTCEACRWYSSWCPTISEVYMEFGAHLRESTVSDFKASDILVLVDDYLERKSHLEEEK